MDSVQGQVNEVKVILKDNINKVLERGERLDDLVDKTHDLQATVSIIKKTIVFFFFSYPGKVIRKCGSCSVENGFKQPSCICFPVCFCFSLLETQLYSS